MKVTEETFPLSRRSAGGARYQRYRYFQAKGKEEIDFRKFQEVLGKIPERKCLQSFPYFYISIFQFFDNHINPYKI
jgi:hypothetical protein